ncbi:MAG TPA: ABC transporter permease [Flavisolibacter sp.]|jgi:ABC-type antimicrobial peptide transport system permease subunit|nr:ABC transporter permease [Flavisolibacter sp.]
MFKSYLKVAFRNLLRNKAFSIINISGLAIGMASAMLIFLWIQNEVSYDQFHEKKDRIYEAWNLAQFSGKLQAWNTTPKVLARTLERDLPEVEEAVRVNWPNDLLFTVGEKRLTAKGNTVDSGFFDLFSFPLVKGNAKTALMDMHNIVLTEKLAKKLFGTEEAMGKTIKIDNKDNFTVTAIVKDPPNNTRFNFEYLVPWSYLRSQGGDDEYWGNNSTRTYVMLKKNATLASVAPKMKTLRKKYDKDDQEGQFFIYPMDRWRLYSKFTAGVEDGGRIEFVRLFGIIAGFILLIACINFMNLSTARSEKRAKEVGIRKVVGARKGSLIGQFIGESIILAFLAGIVAIGIVELSLPGFNKLTDKHLFIDFSDTSYWIYALLFILFTGVVSGSYPAFYLSSFQPVRVLKGVFKPTNALVTPRKVLVVLQFTFAIMLIISTIIVKQQIDHARNRDTGYDKNNLVYHMLTGDLDKNYDLVKNELLNAGIATSISKTSAPLTQGWSDSWGFEWAGKAPDDKTDFDRFCADENIVRTAGFQLISGRDFNLKEYPTDSLGILLNESAVKAMGFKEPLGQLIKDNGKEWHVVGVIKDFILQSPYYPLKPMVIEGSQGWFNVMHMKLNPNKPLSQSLKAMESIFKKYNPEYPFEYRFIDEDYALKFEDEKRTGTLAALFAGLTIFISCLGLFGLAAYMAQNRLKEIGVRKVLGASVTNITTLLSKDFMKLVVISLVIAAPLAGYGMYKWLQNYPYRVGIEWWVFAVAGISAFLIALLTVSFQAIKAALANPVKNLRTE